MPKFKQKILTPGRYPKGDDFQDLTPEDLAEYVEGTREMLSGGLGVQVIKKHALPGSDEGGAQDSKPESKDGIGWLTDIVQGSDGSVTATFDVPLKADAERIKKKVDRFTSVETRHSHTDGKGRKFGKHFAHLALTPRPRDPDQGEIVAVDSEQFCYQFSLDDRVDPMPISKQAKEKAKREAAKKLAAAKKAKQFAEHENGAKEVKEKKEGKNNTGHENGEDISGKIAQVKEMLSAIGVEIPADSDDPISFLDQLIGALSAMAEATPENKENLEEVSPEITQFTEQINALKGQLNAANREKLAAMIEAAKLPPALADPLLIRARAVQFSDNGTQKAILTVAEVVELFAGAIPENLQFSEDGQPIIADHPKPGYFDPPTENGQLSAEAGAAEAKAMLEEMGTPVKV